MRNIFVIAAHPDDEVLGCGGTIRKHVERGDQVHVLILGEGATSRDESRNVNNRSQELSQLGQQTQNAMNILGVKSLYCEGLPDNRFDSLDLLDVVKKIEKFKSLLGKIDVVYTHHRGDVNVDHRVTFDAVLTAFRGLPGEHIPELYSFYVPSSTEWAYSTICEFKPNYFVNIQSTLGKKLEAMDAYRNELRSYPHPRSLEGVEIVAKYWGLFNGQQASEPFMLIRKIDEA